ncbi:MAG: LacI family DNA-binding transcriptional regulator, partial [Actinobacteria bacterium]|nr:LacI family DNA-binding transcriptional regulator [Actinomycetota bacterium]
MKQKITMKFIAEKASVSVATVSSVINNSNFVSKKLTDRVNKTIKKYKYQKDFLATSLRKRMTKLIGIVIVDLTNTINAILCSEVEKLFRKHGYNTTISSSELDFKVEQECIYELINRNIDGIIIIPLREGRENYKNLFDSGKPVVILNREFKNTNSDFIMFDSYNAMVDTIDHLANLGHKRIAYINRAIFWGRKIIIMDEPTAALGVKESAKVLDMILNIRQNLDGII